MARSDRQKRRAIPGGAVPVIEAGTFRLCPETRRVGGPAGESRLTPKLCQLLALFLQHPGQPLTRAFIMRQVWETDYLGDMRTLDVHVSRLRRRIEPDPRRPSHLLTVRGLGYVFYPRGRVPLHEERPGQ